MFGCVCVLLHLTVLPHVVLRHFCCLYIGQNAVVSNHVTQKQHKKYACIHQYYGTLFKIM